MDTSTVDAYLRRIGVRPTGEPDASLLRELHARHLMTVPFENLDFHLGERVALGPPAVEKVVRKRRGGTCRELNASAFPALLRALGYPVTLLGSRVNRDTGPGTALGHTVMRVETPEPWLVDVGFGRGSRYPLRLDLRTEQKDPHGTFVVADAPYGDLDLIRDGRLLYRIETRPREVEDFLPVLWWFQTSPDSPFRRHLFCSLATERGRITLSGDTLITSENGRQDKVRLVGDDEIRDAYRVHFGIEIDRLPPLPSPVAGAPEIP